MFTIASRRQEMTEEIQAGVNVLNTPDVHFLWALGSYSGKLLPKITRLTHFHLVNATVADCLSTKIMNHDTSKSAANLNLFIYLFLFSYLFR